MVVKDAFKGPGYGHITSEAIVAIRLLASQEGLLLDPVYSGKAFAGVLSQARTGELGAYRNVLFLVTGGTPALYAYRADLQGTRTGLEAGHGQPG